jgi:hypothetical protein
VSLSRRYRSMGGMDPRARERSERAFGRFISRDEWSGSVGYALAGTLAHPDYAISAAAVPFVTDSPPFYPQDDAGATFPAGTLWVCFPSVSAGLGQVISSGVVVTFDCVRPLQTQYMYYRAVPRPGTSGTVTLRKFTSGTTICSISVSYAADGPYIEKAFPSFTGFDDDQVEVVSVWSGGDPRVQGISADPQTGAGGWFAVPPTIPTGATARYDTDTQRDGLKAGANATVRRGQCRYPRAYSKRHRTYESICSGFALGVPTQAVFHQGIPWYYNWMPIATMLVEVTQVFIGTDVNVSPPFGTPFWIQAPRPVPVVRGGNFRAIKIEISAPGPTGTSITLDMTREDTGASVYSRTFTDSEIQADTVDTIGGFAHANLDETANLIITLHHPDPTGHYTGAPVTVKVSPSYAIDRTFPFTVITDNLVAPGSYWPSRLESFLLGDVLTVLSPGTSSNPASTGPVAYVPTLDNWYQLDRGNTNDFADFGEDPWYKQGNRYIARGHAGRRIYLNAAACGDTSIASYTPSFTPCIAAGTTMDSKIGGWWAFASIQFPAAGRYRVWIKPTNLEALLRGFDVEWSRDTKCLYPTKRQIWEAIDEMVDRLGLNAYALYQGVTASPPADASSGCWIVADGATGRFQGHAGDIVAWDTQLYDWRFFKPEFGSVLRPSSTRTSSAFHWFNGSAWVDETVAPVQLTIETTAANETVYISVGAYTSEFDTTATPSIRVGYDTLT